MIEIITGIAIGVILFLCCCKAYILGLRHGKELSKGNVPKVELNPVKAYKEHKEHKTEQEKQNTEATAWQNLFSYDGTPQKEVKQ